MHVTLLFLRSARNTSRMPSRSSFAPGLVYLAYTRIEASAVVSSGCSLHGSQYVSQSTLSKNAGGWDCGEGGEVSACTAGGSMVAGGSMLEQPRTVSITVPSPNRVANMAPQFRHSTGSSMTEESTRTAACWHDGRAPTASAH